MALCLGFEPPRHDDADLREALGELDALLPGEGPRKERLVAWDRRLEIPVDRLPGVIDWLVERFRDRARRDFGLPDGEDLRVSIVTRPAVVRLQLVRRRRGAPASISTPTCRSVPPTSS